MKRRKLQAKKSRSSGRVNHLVIMAKQPKLGQVKTRLGKDIGLAAATRFYRHNLKVLARRLGGDQRWSTTVAISPDNAVCSVSHLFECDVRGQGRGGLGGRMASLFDKMPPGPVIIIGSDIPNIPPNTIADAFAQLGGHDAVIGAGEDGGYWLIGVKRCPVGIKSLFEDVRWSSQETYKDTMRNLSGKSVALIKPLNDIDDGADYLSWQSEGGIY